MKNLKIYRAPVYRLFPAVGLALLALLCLPATGWTQKATAELSQDVAAVGQAVQLNISVVGGRGARVPTDIQVEGLNIRFAGRSEQVNVVNFQMTVSSVFSYQVLPYKTGEFTIPALTVAVEGKKLKTAPVTLKVGGNVGGVPALPAVPANQPPGGGGSSPYGSLQQQIQQQMQQMRQMQQQMQQQVQQPPPPPPTAQAAPAEPLSDDQIAFGELVLPKKSAYVGEVIPVELRFYFTTSYPIEVANRPTFSGDGFTVMNVTDPRQQQKEVKGEHYNVVVFKTAITPVKAGELTISPATIESNVTIPTAAPQAVDDYFGGFFQGGRFGGDVRQLIVKTEPVTLEIKRLPKEGRPDDFHGAIGQFTLAASASPKKAEAGEPITLQVVVSGKGNFDAITAPTLQDAEAWKSYPPNEKFESSPTDPIGFNGQKFFDYSIVARTDTQQTPAPEFSFFDPAVEKYVTLRAEPVKVAVKGNGPGTASAPAAVASAPSPTAAPTVPPVAPAVSSPADDLVAAGPAGTFMPFYLQPAFLLVNAVAATVWLALLAFGMVKAWSHSSSARKSQERREAKRLLHRLEDSGLSAEEVFQTATQIIRVRLAPEGSMLPARDLIEQSELSAERRQALRAILDRGDELVYSAGGVGINLGATERQEIFQQLKKFHEELR